MAGSLGVSSSFHFSTEIGSSKGHEDTQQIGLGVFA
jgi:hypothetical protein